MNVKQMKLYDAETTKEKKAVEKAVNEINHAIKTATKKAKKTFKKETVKNSKFFRQTVENLFEMIIEPVCEKHSKTGADDTHSRNAIFRTFKKEI